MSKLIKKLLHKRNFSLSFKEKNFVYREGERPPRPEAPPVPQPEILRESIFNKILESKTAERTEIEEELKKEWKINPENVLQKHLAEITSEEALLSFIAKLDKPDIQMLHAKEIVLITDRMDQLIKSKGQEKLYEVLFRGMDIVTKQSYFQNASRDNYLVRLIAQDLTENLNSNISDRTVMNLGRYLDEHNLHKLKGTLEKKLTEREAAREKASKEKPKKSDLSKVAKAIASVNGVQINDQSIEFKVGGITRSFSLDLLGNKTEQAIIAAGKDQNKILAAIYKRLLALKKFDARQATRSTQEQFDKSNEALASFVKQIEEKPAELAKAIAELQNAPAEEEAVATVEAPTGAVAAGLASGVPVILASPAYNDFIKGVNKKGLAKMEAILRFPKDFKGNLNSQEGYEFLKAVIAGAEAITVTTTNKKKLKLTDNTPITLDGTEDRQSSVSIEKYNRLLEKYRTLKTQLADLEAKYGKKAAKAEAAPTPAPEPAPTPTAAAPTPVASPAPSEAPAEANPTTEVNGYTYEQTGIHWFNTESKKDGAIYPVLGNDKKEVEGLGGVWMQEKTGWELRPLKGYTWKDPKDPKSYEVIKVEEEAPNPAPAAEAPAPGATAQPTPAPTPAAEAAAEKTAEEIDITRATGSFRINTNTKKVRIINTGNSETAEEKMILDAMKFIQGAFDNLRNSMPIPSTMEKDEREELGGNLARAYEYLTSEGMSQPSEIQKAIETLLERKNLNEKSKQFLSDLQTNGRFARFIKLLKDAYNKNDDTKFQEAFAIFEQTAIEARITQTPDGARAMMEYNLKAPEAEGGKFVIKDLAGNVVYQISKEPPAHGQGIKRWIRRDQAQIKQIGVFTNDEGKPVLAIAGDPSGIYRYEIEVKGKKKAEDEAPAEKEGTEAKAPTEEELLSGVNEILKRAKENPSELETLFRVWESDRANFSLHMGRPIGTYERVNVGKEPSLYRELSRIPMSNKKRAEICSQAAKMLDGNKFLKAYAELMAARHYQWADEYQLAKEHAQAVLETSKQRAEEIKDFNALGDEKWELIQYGHQARYIIEDATRALKAAEGKYSTRVAFTTININIPKQLKGTFTKIEDREYFKFKEGDQTYFIQLATNHFDIDPVLGGNEASRKSFNEKYTIEFDKKDSEEITITIRAKKEAEATPTPTPASAPAAEEKEGTREHPDVTKKKTEIRDLLRTFFGDESLTLNANTTITVNGLEFKPYKENGWLKDDQAWLNETYSYYFESQYKNERIFFSIKLQKPHEFRVLGLDTDGEPNTDDAREINTNNLEGLQAGIKAKQDEIDKKKTTPAAEEPAPAAEREAEEGEEEAPTEIPEGRHEASFQKKLALNAQVKALRENTEMSRKEKHAKFEELINSYNTVAREALSNNDHLTDGELTYNVGILYRDMADYNNAQQWFKYALEQFKLAGSASDSEDTQKMIAEMQREISLTEKKEEAKKLIQKTEGEPINDEEVEVVRQAVESLADAMIDPKKHPGDVIRLLEEIDKNLWLTFNGQTIEPITFMFKKADGTAISTTLTWNNGFGLSTDSVREKYAEIKRIATEEGEKAASEMTKDYENQENQVKETRERFISDILEIKKELYGEDSSEYTSFKEQYETHKKVLEDENEQRNARARAATSQLEGGEIITDSVKMDKRFGKLSEEEIRDYITQMRNYDTVEKIMVEEFGLTKHEVPERLAKMISECSNDNINFEDVFKFMKGFDRSKGRRTIQGILESPTYREYYKRRLEERIKVVSKRSEYAGWVDEGIDPVAKRVAEEELGLPKSINDLLPAKEGVFSTQDDAFRKLYEELREKHQKDTINPNERALLTAMHTEIFEPVAALIQGIGDLEWPKGGLDRKRLSGREQILRGIEGMEDYHSNAEILAYSLNVPEAERKAVIQEIAKELPNRDLEARDVLSVIGVKYLSRKPEVQKLIGTKEIEDMIFALQQLTAKDAETDEVRTAVSKALEEADMKGKSKKEMLKALESAQKEKAKKVLTADYDDFEGMLSEDPWKAAFYEHVLQPAGDLAHNLNTLRKPDGSNAAEIQAMIHHNPQLLVQQTLERKPTDKKETMKEVEKLLAAFERSEVNDPEWFVGWFAGAERAENIEMQLINGERMWLEEGLFKQFYTPASAVLAILNTPGLYENGASEKVLKKQALIHEVNRYMQIGYAQLMLKEGTKQGGAVATHKERFRLSRYQISSFDDLAKMNIEQIQVLQLGFIIEKASKHFGAVEKAKAKGLEKKEKLPKAVEEALEELKEKGATEKQLDEIRRIMLGEIYLHWHNAGEGTNFEAAALGVNIPLSDGSVLKLVGGVKLNDNAGPILGVIQTFSAELYKSDSSVITANIGGGIVGQNIAAQAGASGELEWRDGWTSGISINGGLAASFDFANLSPGGTIMVKVLDGGNAWVEGQIEDATEKAEKELGLRTVLTNWENLNQEQKLDALKKLPGYEQIRHNIDQIPALNDLTPAKRDQMLVQALDKYIHQVEKDRIYEEVCAFMLSSISVGLAGAWTSGLAAIETFAWGPLVYLTFMIGDVQVSVLKPGQGTKLAEDLAKMEMSESSRKSIMERYQSIAEGKFSLEAFSETAKLAENPNSTQRIIRIQSRGQKLTVNRSDLAKKEGRLEFNIDNRKWKKAGIKLSEGKEGFGKGLYRLEVQNKGDKDVRIYPDPLASSKLALVHYNGEVYVEGNLSDMVVQRLTVELPHPTIKGKTSLQDIIYIGTFESSFGGRDLQFAIDHSDWYLEKTVSGNKFQVRAGVSNTKQNRENELASGKAAQENFIDFDLDIAFDKELEKWKAEIPELKEVLKGISAAKEVPDIITALKEKQAKTKDLAEKNRLAQTIRNLELILEYRHSNSFMARLSKFRQMRQNFRREKAQGIDLARLDTMQENTKKLRGVLTVKEEKEYQDEVVNEEELKRNLEQLITNKKFEHEFNSEKNISDPEKQIAVIKKYAKIMGISLSPKKLSILQSYLMQVHFTNILRNLNAKPETVINEKAKETIRKRIEKLRAHSIKVYTAQFAEYKAENAADLATRLVDDTYKGLLEKLNTAEITYGELFKVGEKREDLGFMSASWAYNDEGKKVPVLLKSLNLSNTPHEDGVISEYGFIGKPKKYSLQSKDPEEKQIAALLLEIASPVKSAANSELMHSPLAEKMLGTSVEIQLSNGSTETKEVSLYDLWTKMNENEGGQKQFDAVIEMYRDPNTISKHPEATQKFRAFLETVRKHQIDGTALVIENSEMRFELDMTGTEIIAGAHTKCTNASAAVDEKGGFKLGFKEVKSRAEIEHATLRTTNEVTESQNDILIVEGGIGAGLTTRKREKPQLPKNPDGAPSSPPPEDKAAARGPATYDNGETVVNRRASGGGA